jgi:hypothetical protein
MVETRTVFIDGLPGSGKSTIAEWLSSTLASQNSANDAYHEQCNDHPLRIYDPIYTDFTSPEQSKDFREKSIVLFSTFVQQELGKNTVSIFDSWLFQATIGLTFLLRMDMSDSTDFAFALLDILAPLNPVIIYLAQSDVEQNWRRICSIRGPAFSQGRCGFAEDFDYVKAGIAWSANQEFCLSFLRKSRMRHLVIMNTDYDFVSHKARIADFLELERQ